MSTKDVSIEKFVEWLNQFSRNDCPDKYYQAWKILILKTKEYWENNSEFQILSSSYETWARETLENVS